MTDSPTTSHPARGAERMTEKELEYLKDAAKDAKANYKLLNTLSVSPAHVDQSQRYGAIVYALEVITALPALLSEIERYQWRDIATAPKDGTPILVLSNHEADPFHLPDGKSLTPYRCYCEGMGSAPNGIHIAEWGGGDSDYDEWSQRSYEWPDWWFVAGSDCEIAVNPTHWMPLPEPPAVTLPPSGTPE